MKKKQSGYGIAGMILGIIGLVSSCIPAGVVLCIAGIVLSGIAFSKKNNGHGTAIAGLCCSIIGAIISIFVLFAGTGIFDESEGSENDTEISEEKDYIDEKDIEKVYADADAYKGRYLKFVGVVLDVEKDDEGIYLQVFQDIENYGNNTLVKYKNSELDIKEDDYVEIDGKVLGGEKGENAFGGTIYAPVIDAINIEKLSYKDAIHPTIKEVSVNETIEDDGVFLTLEKFEFAEKQTRAYISLENKTEYDYSLYTYSARAVQGSKQFDVSFDYNSDYEEMKDSIMPGVNSSGVLVFEGMDIDKDVTIYIEGNKESTFDSFSYEFKVKLN